MDILFIGDVVGGPGRKALRNHLERNSANYDIVVANGENAAGGRGITHETARELFAAGVHVLTMGNHVWDKKEAMTLLPMEGRIVRPANYPEGLPGKGLGFYPAGNGRELAVLNLSGRAFLDPLDDPFRIGHALLKKARERTPFILVDFHAEATSEKRAFRYHVDGMASLLVGTHTHVQTNDDEITASGMGYITDVGMTGPIESVIGMNPEDCLQRFLRSVPARLQTAGGAARLCGVRARLDPSGRCVELVKIREDAG